MNVCILWAGAKAEIEVCLVMELSVHTDGGVSFVLPTVLNPRYSPADLQHKGTLNIYTVYPSIISFTGILPHVVWVYTMENGKFYLRSLKWTSHD